MLSNKYFHFKIIIITIYVKCQGNKSLYNAGGFRFCFKRFCSLHSTLFVFVFVIVAHRGYKSVLFEDQS